MQAIFVIWEIASNDLYMAMHNRICSFLAHLFGEVWMCFSLAINALLSFVNFGNHSLNVCVLSFVSRFLLFITDFKQFVVCAIAFVFECDLLCIICSKKRINIALFGAVCR